MSRGRVHPIAYKVRAANFLPTALSEVRFVLPDDSGLYANEDRDASRLLIRRPPSVDLLGRLPAAPLFLPSQPAYGPPHGGDGDPLPMLALPQLAVAL